MSAPSRACSRCGGALDQPLPPDLLDPRLASSGLVLRCHDCGHAERVDEPPRERSGSR